MPVSLAQFVQAIDASGILDSRDLAGYLACPAPPADAAALAARLVADGRLTAYQAKQASSGDVARLVMGPYLIQEEVGRGGMGCVYRAVHRADGRHVALKVIDAPRLRDSDAARRFEREFQAATALDHRHIVGAIECGEAGGVRYLVMEFVAGQTLAQLVDTTGPQPIGDVVDWVRQAAAGLAHAHDRGVVHRDIKPANLMLDTEGCVRILDLGLARLDDRDAGGEQLTVTGQVLGTVDFMAPEQALDTRRADARSDIYSLGATLWYLATARPLFPGETAVARVIAHQKADRPSLATACPESGPPLDAIFQRMVANRPEDRFPSMRALLDAFDEVANTADGPGLPAPSRRRPVAAADGSAARARPGRRRLWAAGRVAVLAAGVAALTAIAVPWFRSAARVFVDSAPAPTRPRAPAPDSATPLRPVAAWPDAAPPPPAVTPLETAAAQRLQSEWADFLGVSVTPESPTGIGLALIPPGHFTMGEPPRSAAVTLTRPFLLGRTEVTQGQWRAVMGPRDATQPSPHPVDDANPMNQVSWDEAVAFCRRLTDLERAAGWLRPDQAYRLPTEAEWECGCRTGTNTAFSFGDDPAALNDYAWWGGGWDDDRKEFVLRGGTGNCKEEMFAHPVGLKRPNAWGLHDMHGNLWEWCADWDASLPTGPLIDPAGPAEGTQRVRRGGSWSHPALRARSASRLKDLPATRANFIGFRVALDP